MNQWILYACMTFGLLFSSAWGEPKTVCFVMTHSTPPSEGLFFAADYGWEKGLSPYFLLKRELKPSDYRLVLMEERGHFKEAQMLILYNLPSPQVLESMEKAVPQNKRVLFLMEPPCTDRRSYNAKHHDAFAKVFTWDDALVDGIKYFKFHYPVLRKPMLDPIIPFSQKKLCTMIARNKKSVHPDELYSQRQDVIRFFENHHPRDFDFYGQRWPQDTYKTYRGTVERKAPVLARYRFCICFENMCNIKGYISEKIFDSFYAGAVPVYWGASNVEEYIPSQCFIDGSQFETWDALYHFLKNMTEGEHQVYLDNIRAYLDSAKSAPFSPEAHAELLRQIIIELGS